MSSSPLRSSHVAGQGAHAYLAVDAQSRSPLELVVMLYDGALRFVQQARDAEDRGDVRARAAAISRTLAIIGELQSTLNMEEGKEIAAELDRLYHYITRRLVDVTVKREIAALDEVQKLLSTLRDGWVQAASAIAPPGRP